MPELPDISLYIDALQRFIGDKRIEQIQLRSPFLVRSVEPDLLAAQGKHVRGFRRLGKKIVWELDGDLFLVFHLMIAGRFHWRKQGAAPRGKNDLAAFTFDNGVLMLTEASQKKRAALHVVAGQANLHEHPRPPAAPVADHAVLDPGFDLLRAHVPALPQMAPVPAASGPGDPGLGTRGSDPHAGQDLGDPGPGPGARQHRSLRPGDVRRAAVGGGSRRCDSRVHLEPPGPRLRPDA